MTLELLILNYPIQYIIQKNKGYVIEESHLDERPQCVLSVQNLQATWGTNPDENNKNVQFLCNSKTVNISTFQPWKRLYLHIIFP